MKDGFLLADSKLEVCQKYDERMMKNIMSMMQGH